MSPEYEVWLTKGQIRWLMQLISKSRRLEQISVPSSEPTMSQLREAWEKAE